MNTDTVTIPSSVKVLNTSLQTLLASIDSIQYALALQTIFSSQHCSSYNQHDDDAPKQNECIIFAFRARKKFVQISCASREIKEMQTQVKQQHSQVDI